MILRLHLPVHYNKMFYRPEYKHVHQCPDGDDFHTLQKLTALSIVSDESLMRFRCELLFCRLSVHYLGDRYVQFRALVALPMVVTNGALEICLLWTPVDVCLDGLTAHGVAI
jgi:hypothetical protein